jgi:hypothetical protein
MDPNRFRRPSVSPHPEPNSSPPPNPAFVIYPAGFFVPISPELAAWQQAIYQWAFEQAQQLLKPSRMERDWLGVWN